MPFPSMIYDGGGMTSTPPMKMDITPTINMDESMSMPEIFFEISNLPHFSFFYTRSGVYSQYLTSVATRDVAGC